MPPKTQRKLEAAARLKLIKHGNVVYTKRSIAAVFSGHKDRAAARKSLVFTPLMLL